MPVALPSSFSNLTGLAPLALPSGPVLLSCATLSAHDDTTRRAKHRAAHPDFPSITVMLCPSVREDQGLAAGGDNRTCGFAAGWSVISVDFARACRAWAR